MTMAYCYCAGDSTPVGFWLAIGWLALGLEVMTMFEFLTMKLFPEPILNFRVGAPTLQS